MDRVLARWSRRLALVAGLCALAATAAAFAPAFEWRLPAGVAPPPVPADNPMSDAKVALGRRLFYDADLSIDGTMACATCHEQRRAFTDSNATHPGVHGDPGRRNIMALANVGYFSSLTWGDPRVARLEDQALIPIAGQHPVEMGFAQQEHVLTARLAADACYQRMFVQAFPEAGGEVSMATIGKALGAFQRTLLSFDAPYDQRRRGQDVAISTEASRGQKLFFGTAQCSTCHAGPLFTDATSATPERGFHRIDLPFSGDQGRGEITGRASDQAQFRTPSLRNVALTWPYLHDGSAKSLSQAIRRHRIAIRLGETQVADLVAFLDTLTDQRFVADPRFSLPAPGCAG
jgi:cytochrome c peroxidase